MKRGYADLPEGQMHYLSEGDGPALLLLHAAVTSSGEFARVIPFLSGAYRAVAPDFLGQGDSGPAPYRYEYLDHARTVLSFMDALGIEKASIVGHHAGALIGAELAIASPGRVDKLVLSGVALWQTSDGAAVVDPPNFTGQVEIHADGSHLMEWWRRASLWGDPLEIVEERLLEYVKAGPKGEEAHWAGRAYDARPRLPLIGCPTLVLCGTDDPFYPMAEDVKDLIPNSRLTIVEKGPIHIDRVMPEEFAAAILSFLRAQ